jgi:hypothetical protein
MKIDFLNEWKHSLDSRFNEIDILKNLIQQNTKELETKNVLLKNYTVFLVSNFEGSLKSLAQSYIEDLNDSDLTAINLSIRCHQASHYTTKDEKLKVLAELFNENAVPIEKEMFPGVSINYNPKESNIKKLFKNLGLNDLVQSLDTHLFDCLFNDNHGEQDELIKSINDYLDPILGDETDNFKQFDFGNKNKPSTKFWENFIIDVMQKRNNIVHGSETENGIPEDEMEIYTKKVLIFIKAACISILNNHTKKVT